MKWKSFAAWAEARWPGNKPAVKVTPATPANFRKARRSDCSMMKPSRNKSLKANTGSDSKKFARE